MSDNRFFQELKKHEDIENPIHDPVLHLLDEFILGLKEFLGCKIEACSVTFADLREEDNNWYSIYLTPKGHNAQFVLLKIIDHKTGLYTLEFPKHGEWGSLTVGSLTFDALESQIISHCPFIVQMAQQNWNPKLSEATHAIISLTPGTP